MNVTVDTRAFDAALKKYMEFNKKAIPEIINTKAYFVARNAVTATETTDAAKIEQQLRATANSHSAPLGAILVNLRQRSKGLQGLNGSKMATAVNKLIRARKRTVNFLRAGWIPAIQKVGLFLPKKPAAVSKKVKTFGAPQGGASGANPTRNWRCFAEIWNDVTGGDKDDGTQSNGNPTKVASIIEAGLQKAIDKETRSMQAYVEKKLNEGIDRFNKG
jgi:hypothetical protein